MLKRRIDKDTYTALPADIAAEYTLDGDEYVLDVDGPSQADLEAVLKAKKHEAEARKEAEKLAKSYRAELDKVDTDGGKKAAERIQAEYEERLKAHEEKIATLRKTAESQLVGSTAQQIAEKIFGENATIGLPHLERRVTAVWDEDASAPTLTYLDERGKATTREKLESEFLTAKHFSAIVKSTGASGARPPNGSAVPPSAPTFPTANPSRRPMEAIMADIRDGKIVPPS